MTRKDFKKRNEGFPCLKCGVYNEKAVEHERNHCFSCLYSLHVDEETPGDRKSRCNGLMQPIALEYKGKKGFMIVHQCEKCNKIISNMTLSDDNIQKIASCSGSVNNKRNGRKQ